MQGHAFAGPHQVAGPKLLFGERGRMDERMDLVRSVTDGRYVYLRNYYTHVSQGQHIQYQFQTPTTRVWRELFDRGLANEAQSIFWRVPKAPEELYDLQTDPDEVHNLAALPAHQDTLVRLRSALRAHLLEVRDVGFLPEAEMHARAAGGSPYTCGHDPSRFLLEAILEAAELASGLDPAAVARLVGLAAHEDGAVRYWAVLGLRMRGAATVRAHGGLLEKALDDASPDVRIAAAEALGQFGDETQRRAALDVLRALASPKDNGVLVAMPALAAIEALGDRSAELRSFLSDLDPSGASPDRRFDGYVPRLIENITGTPPRRP
jgi:uncharacterized sulfatase